ncbi:MAG: hypothetical protein ABIJ09_24465 [Pseudomonadota bacterium]
MRTMKLGAVVLGWMLVLMVVGAPRCEPGPTGPLDSRGSTPCADGCTDACCGEVCCAPGQLCQGGVCCLAHWCVDFGACAIYASCEDCPAAPADIDNGLDDDCDGAIDEGSSNVCIHVDCGAHGRCVDDQGSAACDCDSGYEVREFSCEPIDPCQAVDCGSHGTCESIEDSPSCVCAHGYLSQGLGCVQDPRCDCTGQCAGAEDGCGGLCESNDCNGLCCDAVCCEPGLLCDDAGGCCAARDCMDFSSCTTVQTCGACGAVPRDVRNNRDDDCDGEVDEDALDPRNPFPMRPALWLEANAADDSTGYGLNWPVVFALRGHTPNAHNLRIIHPWYAPWNTPWSADALRQWARETLADPELDGIALDHEGWTLSMGATILRVLYEEAEAAGKVFCDVPKISLDHAIAGTSTFNQRAALLQQYTHCVSPWCYSCKADAYLAYVNMWRAAGYTKQILPMGDAGMRPHYGSITKADAILSVNTLANHGISWALFLPHYDDGTVLSVMQQRYP